MSYNKSGVGLFRFSRGSQKFSQSWDAQKMREREEARERARAAKLYRKTAADAEKFENMGGL